MAITWRSHGKYRTMQLSRGLGPWVVDATQALFQNLAVYSSFRLSQSKYRGSF